MASSRGSLIPPTPTADEQRKATEESVERFFNALRGVAKAASGLAPMGSSGGVEPSTLLSSLIKVLQGGEGTAALSQNATEAQQKQSAASLHRALQRTLAQEQPAQQSRAAAAAYAKPPADAYDQSKDEAWRQHRCIPAERPLPHPFGNMRATRQQDKHPVWHCKRDGCKGTLILLGHVKLHYSLQEAHARALRKRAEFPKTFVHGSQLSCTTCGDRPRSGSGSRYATWQRLCRICNEAYAMNGFWEKHGGYNNKGVQRPLERRAGVHQMNMRRNWRNLQDVLTLSGQVDAEKKWLLLANLGLIKRDKTPVSNEVVKEFAKFIPPELSATDSDIQRPDSVCIGPRSSESSWSRPSVVEELRQTLGHLIPSKYPFSFPPAREPVATATAIPVAAPVAKPVSEDHYERESHMLPMKKRQYHQLSNASSPRSSVPSRMGGIPTNADADAVAAAQISQMMKRRRTASASSYASSYASLIPPPGSSGGSNVLSADVVEAAQALAGSHRPQLNSSSTSNAGQPISLLGMLQLSGGPPSMHGPGMPTGIKPRAAKQEWEATDANTKAV